MGVEELAPEALGVAPEEVPEPALGVEDPAPAPPALGAAVEVPLPAFAAPPDAPVAFPAAAPISSQLPTTVETHKDRRLTSCATSGEGLDGRVKSGVDLAEGLLGDTLADGGDLGHDGVTESGGSGLLVSQLGGDD